MDRINNPSPSSGYTSTSRTEATNVEKHGEVIVKSSMSALRLLKEGNAIDPHLLEFLLLFGIEHDGTVASVDQAMQANFIRKPGLERKDLKDNEEEQSLRPRALELLKLMGMVDEIPHSEVSADYLLLFGAMLNRMRSRFADFLIQHNQKTFKCRNVILLGGVRKIMKGEMATIEHDFTDEYIQQLLTQVGKQDRSCLTEADLWRVVWDQEASEELKANFKEGKNLFFINSTQTTDGTNNRPTTKTTLEEWYATCQPEPGSCHGNVEKPYGVRMEKVLRILLSSKSKCLGTGSKRFSITWNSPAAVEKLPIAVYKDELARTFHEEILLKRVIKP